MYDDKKVDKDIFSNLKKKEGIEQALFSQLDLFFE